MISDPRNEVSVFTDGSCLGNPGPGGYGIVLKYNGHCRELSAGFRTTTNNRMELLAAVEGLAALKRPCSVALYSDSKYLVEAMTKRWPYSWRDKGWRRGRNQPVANIDLWQRLLDVCEQHKVTFHWVKGHSGHAENERCDALALAAAQANSSAVDSGYETSSNDDSRHATVHSRTGMVTGSIADVDWSQRLMSDDDITTNDRRLKELTTSSLKGKPVRFLCPILMREELTTLSRGHIIPKSTGGKGTVLQRQDVDSFYGSFVQADFSHGVNVQGLTFDDTVRYMLRKRPSSRLQWLLRGPKGDESPVRLHHLDEDHFGVRAQHQLEPSNYQLGLSFDLRYPTLLSCLHSVHLGQFRSLGYRYANSNAGRHISTLLANVFHTFRSRKIVDALQEELEGLCFTHRNMVRPLLSDLDGIDRRLLDNPFEWFLTAWDGDRLFATIHFLRAGQQWNAVMVYNLEPATMLPATALVTSHRPLSFRVSLGSFVGNRIEVGPAGPRINWPCGDESAHLKPYPIRRAVIDLARNLEGMPPNYSIF